MTGRFHPTKDLFPYGEFRENQEKFILQACKALTEGRHVVVSAPNGFGKTISTLCAVIPAALENGLKIVYCCRTHTQNSRVIEELNTIYRHLVERGLVDGPVGGAMVGSGLEGQGDDDGDGLPGWLASPFLLEEGSGAGREWLEDALDEDGMLDAGPVSEIGGVSLRGRGEMCLMDQIRETRLSPADAAAVCAQLRADRRCRFFKRLQAAIDKDKVFIGGLDSIAFDSANVVDHCIRNRFCPYFFSRFLLSITRISVVNYNWLFNPDIQASFLDAVGVAMEDILLIVDEAHNLPALAEEIHSLKLGRFTIENAIKEVNSFFHGRPEAIHVLDFLQLVLEEFNRHEKLVGLKEEMEVDARDVVRRLESGLNVRIDRVLETLDDMGKEVQKKKVEAGRKNPRSSCMAIGRFWRDWIHVTLDKASYYHCFSLERTRTSENYYLEAVCLDPGEAGIEDVMGNVFASISLSGTIVPEAYTALCRVPSPVVFKLPSPFGDNQVKALVLEGVSTGKESRTGDMYRKYLKRILEMAIATPGNSAVFCASYDVLRGIRDAGFEEAIRKAGKYPLCEQPGMTSTENDELIAQFKEYARISRGAVLLGVCGGRNSEGEDFPGDEMNAVMIAGVPYAVPTQRVKRKIEYYDTVFKDKVGWLLGYEIPAIQRANQACGRPIRRMDDRGVIILGDYRFGKKRLLRLLSPWITTGLSKLKDVDGALRSTIETFFSSPAAGKTAATGRRPGGRSR